ncbi:MAG: Ku protein [Bacteroidetes bacterium]|nr:Ku protein [Bacteroidota bacterium]
MRSLWTGAIGFGLVNIPVKLYSATQGSELNLDMLDKKDHSNIRFMRVNERSGKEVSWENIVKGYKYNEEYIILTKEDFEQASSKKTGLMEVSHFVKENEIDSMYYEIPYYLEPEKSGIKAYALLREALIKTGKVGLTTFVMRNKENLAVLKPAKNVIILNRIRFAEEIRDTSGLSLPEKITLKPGELQMAISLINQFSGQFDITWYKDTYTASLLKLIKAKAKGIKIKPSKLKIVHRKTEDLMELLKASLETKQKAS